MDSNIRKPIESGIGGIVITGGASGLGAALTSAVIAAGGAAIVLDRRPATNATQWYEVDVTDEDAVFAAVEHARSQFTITGLVCCAGIDYPGPFREISAAHWNDVLDVNVKGTAMAIRALRRHLAQQRGRIVLVGSTMGLRAFQNATAYCASKFALTGFARALSQELAGEIGVTLIQPSGMNTPFFDTWSTEYKQDASQFLDPHAVAQAIVFALLQPAGVTIRELVITHDSDHTFG